MTYAKGTTVPPERSRAEIESTLKRYGADAFSYGYEGERAVVAFRCQGRYVRFELRVAPLEQFRRTKYTTRTPAQQKKAQEQDVREKWRALLLVIKAKLESVESGIESFDEAFLAALLLPDKTTVGDFLQPQLDHAYETGEMPSLLPGTRPELERGDEA